MPSLAFSQHLELTNSRLQEPNIIKRIYTNFRSMAMRGQREDTCSSKKVPTIGRNKIILLLSIQTSLDGSEKCFLVATNHSLATTPVITTLKFALKLGKGQNVSSGFCLSIGAEHNDPRQGLKHKMYCALLKSIDKKMATNLVTTNIFPN